MEETILEAGFEEIGTYITRRQNTVVHYITTRPIMDLCVLIFQFCRKINFIVKREFIKIMGMYYVLADRGG